MNKENISKKVCHVTSVHDRYDNRIFEKECVSLAQAGFDVTLLVCDDLPDEEKHGVSIVSVGSIYKNKLQRILKSSNDLYAKALSIDAEIYHLHDPELLVLGRKLKRHDKKVVFDSHENYVSQIKIKKYIPRPLRGLVSAIYKNYETKSVGQFDAVVVPCTFNGINIFENRAKRTIYLDNYPIRADLYDTYDPEKNVPNNNVCYVGNLTHERGITHLIKAAYKSGVGLILAGKFQTNEYHEKLQDQKEYECVDYVGFADAQKKVEIYRKSSIGMCTILNTGQYDATDNFPTKAYEYMALGLPVIISTSKYADKIIEKYPFGLSVDPQNVEEISQAIIRLMNNPKEREKMGTVGRKLVRDKFNWENESKKLIDLYNELFMD